MLTQLISWFLHSIGKIVILICIDCWLCFGIRIRFKPRIPTQIKGLHGVNEARGNWLLFSSSVCTIDSFILILLWSSLPTQSAFMHQVPPTHILFTFFSILFTSFCYACMYMNGGHVDQINTLQNWFYSVIMMYLPYSGLFWRHYIHFEDSGSYDIWPHPTVERFQDRM